MSVSSTQGSAGTRYIFANWTGAAQDGEVTATAPTTVTANFITQYQLTTSVSPPGSGSVAASPTSSDGYYNAGTGVRLTASPAAGYVLSSYTPFNFLNNTYPNPWGVGMSGPLSVAVFFTPLTSCDLSQQATTSVSDVQKVISQALGITPPVNDLDGDGRVDSTDVQIMINAAVGLGCLTP